MKPHTDFENAVLSTAFSKSVSGYCWPMGSVGGGHGQADGDHVLVVAVDAGPPDRKAPLAGRALVAQPAQRVAGAVLVFGVDVGELGAKAHVDPGELGPVPLLVVSGIDRGMGL